VIAIRESTRKAIEDKFIYFLQYQNKKTGETSAQRTAQLLKEIGLRSLFKEVLIACLFGTFAAMCYDITAALEARGLPIRETLKLWMKFCENENKKQKIDKWITQAMASD
jgi:hypothetical protein